MKVTEKQLQIMFRVLEGTLSMYDRTDMNLFGYDQETRLRIHNQILNQQSDKLIDVKDAVEQNKADYRWCYPPLNFRKWEHI